MASWARGKTSGELLVAASVLFLFLGPAAMVSGSLCTPYTGINNHTLPLLNGSYVAYMEWWVRDDNSFVFREDHVDQEKNMASVKIYGLFDPGDVYIFISDYNSNQLYTINEKSRSCTVTTIDADASFSFPYVLGGNSSSERISNTPTLLEFGRGLREQYMGQTTVRSKPADHWTSCFKNPRTGYMMEVDYYFTVKDWTTSTTETATPLRSVFTTLVTDMMSSLTYQEQVQTDYVFFQNYIRDTSVFQIPSGVYCKGPRSNSTPPFPSVPGQVRFRAESIQSNTHQIGQYDVWYYPENGLMKLYNHLVADYRADLSHSANTQILDFNMGMSFAISEDSGACEVTAISPDTWNVRMVDSTHVRMVTPQEFFHFHSGNFVYSGQKTARGILTDTWTGQVKDVLNVTSVWEWHFTSSEWSSSVTGAPSKSVPVLLEIDAPDVNQHYLYNIFDFSAGDPYLEDYDVSNCYTSQKNTKRQLQFSLIGNTGLVSKVPSSFRSQIFKKIVQVTGISVLRITHTQVYFYNRGASVTFTLLELPLFKGDVKLSKNPTWNITSDKAVQELQSFLDLGTVFLHFRSNVEGAVISEVMVSVPHSLRDNVQYSNDATSTVRYSTSSSPHTDFSPSSSSSDTRVVTDASPTGIAAQHTESTGGSCAHDHIGNDRVTSEQNAWTSETVAGLCVGVSVFGVGIGFLLAVLLKRRNTKTSRTGDEGPCENNHKLAYSIM